MDWTVQDEGAAVRLPTALASATSAARESIAIFTETPADIAARESLLDRAMGAGRRRKTSEKLRHGRQPAPGLAFVARDGEGRIVGSVRLWNVTLGRGGRPALLLGPLAAEPGLKGKGIGSALMRHAIAQAQSQGHGAVVLVGDVPYYARFGFSAEKMSAVAMPGPFERDRFLGLELIDGYLDGVSGVVVPSGRRERRLVRYFAA